MGTSFKRLVNTYHKAYTIYHRDIEGCPFEKRDSIWSAKYEFTIGLMKKLRGIILKRLIRQRNRK